MIKKLNKHTYITGEKITVEHFFQGRCFFLFADGDREYALLSETENNVSRIKIPKWLFPSSYKLCYIHKDKLKIYEKLIDVEQNDEELLKVLVNKDRKQAYTIIEDFKERFNNPLHYLARKPNEIYFRILFRYCSEEELKKWMKERDISGRTAHDISYDLKNNIAEKILEAEKILFGLNQNYTSQQLRKDSEIEMRRDSFKQIRSSPYIEEKQEYILSLIEALESYGADFTQLGNIIKVFLFSDFSLCIRVSGKFISSEFYEYSYETSLLYFDKLIASEILGYSQPKKFPQVEKVILEIKRLNKKIRSERMLIRKEMS